MTAMIRANRPEVSRQFPVMGFTIRTGVTPSWVEVAIATDPTLFFGADAKAKRSPANFYSSRASGLLPAEKGDVVYLVPPAVLSRFAGQTKIYYALAVYRQGDFRNPEVVRVSPEAMPYVQVSNSFTGARRSLMEIPNRSDGLTGRGAGYVDGDKASLEWGGDIAVPGEMTAIPSLFPAPKASMPPPSANGTTVTPPASTPSAPTMQGFTFAYDDGFGAFPETRSQTAGSEESNEDAQHGIEGPIPDLPVGSVEQGLEFSRTFSSPSEYPQASRFESAASSNYRASNFPRTINRIVIHITDGGSNIAGPISWFKNPSARVSAHYIVGQEGEVVQMVRHNDVAWHAGSANGDSIGIEHVANTRGLNPTEAEYCASAALVNWLCQQYNISMDRDHILGHAEADPNTRHRSCPNAVWNWDYFMGMVTSGSCYPMPTQISTSQGLALTNGKAHAYRKGNGSVAPGSAMLGGESFSINWDDVQLIPQPTNVSCWATAGAMIFGWRDRVSLTPEWIAQTAGSSTQVGMDPSDRRLVAAALGLVVEEPQSYSIDGFRNMLETVGPLWVGARTPLGNHAIVVTGMMSDGNPDGSDTYVRIMDPWDRDPGSPGAPGAYLGTHNTGSRYILTWNEFVREYESRVTTNARSEVNVQIVHAGRTNGRQPNRQGAQGYVMAKSWPLKSAPLQSARSLSGQSFDVNWTEVQLVPQVTGMSCWAAAASMVVGWRDRLSIDPAEIARGAGQWAAYTAGLNPADIPALAQAWGLAMEPPQSYTVNGLRQLLESSGPLWVGAAVPGLHAIVVTGLSGDGTVDNTYVRIKDPWGRVPGTPGVPGNYNPTPDQGSEYVLTLRQFVQEYEGAATDYPAVNIQILHAGGRSKASGAQSLGLGRSLGVRSNTQSSSRSFGGFPFPREGIERMRQEFVTNAAAGAARRNCITIANAGLWQLYGSALQNPDGSNKALGSTIQDTMAALERYGLASAGTVLEFLDGSGRLTKGVARPDRLQSSVESWLLSLADANQMSGWYAFGLSIMDGYHSVILALSFSGIGNTLTRIYWADQIYGGWDDITGQLDTRITQRTQSWWEPLPADRKARTRITIWQLLPGGTSTAQGLSYASRWLTAEPGLADDTEGIEGYEEEVYLGSQGLTLTCNDAFCSVNAAPTASSTHFSLSEFTSRDGNEVPESFRGNIQQVMDNLEVLRSELGDRPLRIASGYRSCTQNTRVEGAEKSRHLCGQAADIQVEGVEPGTVHSTIERLIAAGRMQQGGLGLYDTFVHYDVRGRRARWDRRRRTATASARSLDGPVVGGIDWCQMRQLIAATARAEEARWTRPDGTKIRENDPSMLPILSSYWATVPGFENPSDALNAAQRSAADDPDWPWSAAFICYVMHTAGVRSSHGFEFGSRHLEFIVASLRNRERSDRNRPFWLLDHIEIEREATPQPGDLLCFNRSVSGVWTQHTYSSLRQQYWGAANENLPARGSSHTAIVVGIVERDGVRFVETIGGNEDQSVRLRNNIQLNQSGGTLNPQNHHIFGLIKIIAC